MLVERESGEVQRGTWDHNRGYVCAIDLFSKLSLDGIYPLLYHANACRYCYYCSYAAFPS